MARRKAELGIWLDVDGKQSHRGTLDALWAGRQGPRAPAVRRRGDHHPEGGVVPPNRQPTAEMLRELAALRADLSERAPRERAERLARQASKEGRTEVVARLRAKRRNSVDLAEKG